MIQMQAIRERFGDAKINYEIRKDLVSGETSDWILIPEETLNVMVAFYITSGAGYLEETNDLISNLDTTTLTNQWPYGIVTSNQNCILKPTKAFRFVCTSGSIICTATAR